MKRLSVIFFLLCLNLVNAQDFFRNFPANEFLSQVTKEKFPNADAVILVKEQSVNMKEDRVSYHDLDLIGYSVVETECRIVKLLNEAAVERYGSYEYSYWEDFGDDIPAGFMVRARVLKPNGKIEVLPESEIKKIVSLADHNGNPLKRKILFKIPNLAAGDVVQIEQQLNDPMSEVGSGLFFYNDVDPVLFSNVYLTMPAKYDLDINSFPADKIGAPKIEQISADYGSGKTYFWSVKNLNGIPDEHYSLPFESVAFVTGYVLKTSKSDDVNTWPAWGKYYFDNYIDKGSISGSAIESLSLPRSPQKVDAKLVNEVYTAVKRYFKVSTHKTIIPDSEIKKRFAERTATPSDAAIIMYKILREWNVPSQAVLIRDQRQGRLEQEIVTPEWFNRMGVSVTIDGKDLLFDFDNSIANGYSDPWFINDIDLFVVQEAGSYFKHYSFGDTPDKNSIAESHNVSINEDLSIIDSAKISYKGCFAENLRHVAYEREKRSINDIFRNSFGNTLFSKLDTVIVNNLFDSDSIEVQLAGASSIKAENIDTFLVIRPQEHVFDVIRDKLDAPARKSPVIFDAPYKFEYFSRIAMPRNYVMKGGEIESKISGPANSKFIYTVKSENGAIVIKGTLEMPAKVLPVETFPALMKFFDGAIKKTGREVVLKKIK